MELYQLTGEKKKKKNTKTNLTGWRQEKKNKQENTEKEVTKPLV